MGCRCSSVGRCSAAGAAPGDAGTFGAVLVGATVVAFPARGPVRRHTRPSRGVKSSSTRVIPTGVAESDGEDVHTSDVHDTFRARPGQGAGVLHRAPRVRETRRLRWTGRPVPDGGVRRAGPG